MAAVKRAKTQTATKTPAVTTVERQESPGQTPDNFPIVGIGASAGGLAAFEAFFSGMPANVEPGMAFILVQHLDPNHKSILTALIQRYTRMEVFEVEDGMKVKPNCTYIIPPNCDMAFMNGALQLLEPAEPRGHRLPIDYFFRSLAQDQHERSICIILSGTGSDGTLGLREIKGEGGMVMAQNPESTEFDGMPRSAINTGMVDFILPPAEMPAQLIAYTSHAFSVPRPVSDASKNGSALKKIFVLLRNQTKHDFSNYKLNTINRRVERRMAVYQIATINDYVKYLQQNPKEVDELFHNLLIGVTSFFRDPEAFQALEEQVIPKLFAGKPPGGAIRVWSTGCSTGEEAYSIAILLAERQEALKQTFKIQVFATDIDSRAIASARAGIYPASIEQDLSPERLARFFTAQPGGDYRIHKNIRDMLVFSEQNVIKDPPFSKLDLISCRNLLIYLEGSLQKKLMPLFHYALKPGGVLFLGNSETTGDFPDLFSALDRKAKLYQRKEEFHAGREITMDRKPPEVKIKSEPPVKTTVNGQVTAKQTLRELTEQTLLRQVIHAGALVDRHGNILYLHGRTGMYLELAPGEPGINNILKLAREGLRHELAVELHKAEQTNAIVQRSGLRVKTNGHFTLVDLTIQPVTEHTNATTETPLFLIILEESPAPPEASSGVDTGVVTDTAAVAALRLELQAKEEYLQTANEELETSNEELKSSNEEMQSVNEELQSTNEELETSKEELQSVNEELATVNSELQTKVLDLSHSNNDMNNMLAGTGIGTLFVDIQLRIMRFTPAATKIINLILSDIGRPVAHVVSNLVNYNSLVTDTQAVLDTLIPKELEVQTIEGKSYTMRIQPYRTLDNVIEGVVITFFDISEIVKLREKLQEANALLRLAVVVRDAHDAITVQDLDGRILAWNPGAVRMYGWSEAEALAMNCKARIPAGGHQKDINRLLQLCHAEILDPYHTQRLTKTGEVLEVSIISTALVNEAGQIYAIATTERAQKLK